jgi:hypothetical protein
MPAKARETAVSWFIREGSGVADYVSSMADEHGREIRRVHHSILHKRMELSTDRFNTP